MTPKEIANSFFESEAAMWLAVGANHPDIWLDDLKEFYERWVDAGGMTWGCR